MSKAQGPVAPVEGELVLLVTRGEILGATQSSMTVRHVITTGTLNRNGQKVIQAGGDLSEYRKNPIVLFNHDSSEPAIGRSLGQDFERKLDRWVAETEFAPTEFGRELWALYSGGFMNSWSIGFKPTVDPEYERDKDGELSAIVFPKWALWEYSAVPMPANPDAVNMALREKKISEATHKLLTYAYESTPEEATPEEGFPDSALDKLVSMRLRVRGLNDRAAAMEAARGSGK